MRIEDFLALGGSEARLKQSLEEYAAKPEVPASAQEADAKIELREMLDLKPPSPQRMLDLWWWYYSTSPSFSDRNSCPKCRCAILPVDHPEGECAMIDIMSM